MGSGFCSGDKMTVARINAIVILGLSGSGKSTFTKQIRMAHEIFSPSDLDDVKAILLNNILSGLKELIKVANEQDFVISGSNLKYVRWVTSLPSPEDWDRDDARRLLELWRDDGIQQAWLSPATDTRTIEHLDYIIEKIEDYISPDYVPQRDEILRARQRTTGFTETNFIENKHQWTLIDVGGQLPERQKWNEILSKGCVAFIYFVAIDEYNVKSRENPTKTRLILSLEVFQEVINNPTNLKLCPILFFNKMDRFKMKISSATSFEDFTQQYPSYKGGQDHLEAVKVVESQFKEVVTLDADRLVVHYTCALDAELLRVVFKAVRVHIMEQLFDLYL